jgi:hypothetical protein
MNKKFEGKYGEALQLLFPSLVEIIMDFVFWMMFSMTKAKLSSTKELFHQEFSIRVC